MFMVNELKKEEREREGERNMCSTLHTEIYSSTQLIRNQKRERKGKGKNCIQKRSSFELNANKNNMFLHVSPLNIFAMIG